MEEIDWTETWNLKKVSTVVESALRDFLMQHTKIVSR